MSALGLGCVKTLCFMGFSQRWFWRCCGGLD